MTGFDAIMRAHKLAKKGKTNYGSIINFELSLNANIYKIANELQNKTYMTGEYNRFTIWEPKKRDIMAIEYKDRIVLHALCDEILWPFFDKRMDYDNSSCRVGRGSHFGLRRIARHMRNAYNKHGLDFYILKCDVTKYFHSIRHDVLKKYLYKHISDPDVIWILDKVIDSTAGNVGIPIGNLSSQFFATYYLDVLDRLVRHELKIEYYNRYMDDFILIHHDKKYLTECLNRIKQFLSDEMGLTLNNKTQMFPAKNGVDYLGFHTYITDTGRIVRKIRKRCKQAVKRKIRAFMDKHERGEIEWERIRGSMASWCGHARFGNTYALRERVTARLRIVMRKEE
jgi:hypothetical protein